MTQKNADALKDWHRADVVAELKKKGWSVRALSIAAGLSPNTLKGALQFPYPKGEQIIAAAIIFRRLSFVPSANSGSRFSSHRFAWILASENLEASSHYGIKNTSIGLV